MHDLPNELQIPQQRALQARPRYLPRKCIKRCSMTALQRSCWAACGTPCARLSTSTGALCRSAARILSAGGAHASTTTWTYGCWAVGLLLYFLRGKSLRLPHLRNGLEPAPLPPMLPTPRAALPGFRATLLRPAEHHACPSYRCAIGRRASPAKLRDALAAYAVPGGPLSDTVCAAWESRAPLLLGGETAPPPLLPRYTSCAWRFGITVASAKSPLQQPPPQQPAVEGRDAPGGAAPPGMVPFVSLQLNAAVPGGGAASHALELSLPEFRELAKALRAAARTMASVAAPAAEEAAAEPDAAPA